MIDNNIIPLNNNQSEALELIASGKFDLAVEKISESPEAFNVLVSSIGKKLQEEKKSVEKIRDRNFFKRLFSSNIKDVASIVLSQNETMSNFFVMLQLTAMATKGNAKVLYRICDCLKRGTDAGELEDSSIRRMAISFMEDNIKAIEEEKIRDEAIMKLLKAYAEFKQTTIDIEKKEKGIEQSIAHLRSDVEEKFAKFHRQVDGYIESANKATDLIKQDITALQQYRSKLETYKHLGDVDNIWNDVEGQKTDLAKVHRQVDGYIESANKATDLIRQDVSSLQQYRSKLEAYKHLGDVDNIWNVVEAHKTDLSELHQKVSDYISEVHTTHAEIKDSIRRIEEDNSSAHLKYEKKIKTAYYIGGSAIGLLIINYILQILEIL